MPESLSKVELLQNGEGQEIKLCYAGGVQNLIPFQKPQDWQDSGLSVRAEVTKAGADLGLAFEIMDPYGRLVLPHPFAVKGASVPRKMNLWRGTCFELFLKNSHQEAYYEFNFSLEPAWNLFRFKAYRTPQPPEICHDFSLRSLQWTGKRIQIELFSLTPWSPDQAGLTAVLKEQTGKLHYVALCHKGSKADFHLPESFTIKVE